MVRAQSALAEELESQGQEEEALRVREQTIRELENRLSEQPESEQLRRKIERQH